MRVDKGMSTVWLDGFRLSLVYMQSGLRTGMQVDFFLKLIFTLCLWCHGLNQDTHIKHPARFHRQYNKLNKVEFLNVQTDTLIQYTLFLCDNSEYGYKHQPSILFPYTPHIPLHCIRRRLPVWKHLT